MATRTEARRKLRSYQRQEEGNWRLKGLLLAAFEGSDAVGEAWPTNDRYLSEAQKANPHTRMEGNTVVPGRRGGKERALARSEFSDRELDSEVHRDKYVKRMLLGESESELDTLWREELLDTVIMGAQPRQIARDAATVINVDSRRGDIPRGSAHVYAGSVAEGAEIPTDEESFDTVPYRCDKFGQGFAVTDELVDMAQPDVIERNIRFTGASVENAINREWLTSVVDEANNTADVDVAGGNSLDVGAINGAISEVEARDFTVDSMVMHPEFKGELFNDSNLVYANRSGSDSVLRNREWNQILGVEMFTASDSTYDPDGANGWGFAADGERGAVVFQSEMSGLIVYRDIETKDFEDPLRDLVGGNARAYVDAQMLQPDAAAYVTY